MAVIDGIDENVWVQANMNKMLQELELQKASRDRMVQMRVNFAAKGINVTGTPLEGKGAQFDTLIAKIDEVVDGAEISWLQENTHTSVNTGILD